MLTVTVEYEEKWDSENEVFILRDPVVLELEHSLVSVSKWESKHKKPFLNDTEKTQEELLDYVEMMILTPDYPADIRESWSQSNLDEISAYISDPMTATWFYDPPGGRRSSQTTTSELIYYWMDSYRMAKSYEEWHINRLLTLIRIHNENQGEKKKRSQAEIVAERRMLNERRKKELGTEG